MDISKKTDRLESPPVGSPNDSCSPSASGPPPRSPASSVSSMTKAGVLAAKQSAASKYDFVKVQVHLDSHFFVLSRFLVSRILMGTKIPHEQATKIALDLKKQLVDQGELDVNYSRLEEKLFSIIRTHGYGETQITRYKLLSRFHNERIPLIIVMAGTDCIGKSTLARLLAERLNVPSVLQTDIVYDLIRDTTEEPTKLMHQVHADTDRLIQKYRQECDIVAKGLQADIQKCLKEGKSIILEGIHLDPEWWLFKMGKNKSVQKESMEEFGLPSFFTIDSEIQEAIIVPFVLTLNEDEHRWRISFLQSNLGINTNNNELMNTVYGNLSTVQKYMQETAKTAGIPIIEIDSNHLSETLEAVHDVVLNRITEYFD